MASGIRPEMAPIPAVLGDTSKSITWIAGRNDGVAQLSGISAGYDYTAGPRAQVIIPGAGHNNAFTDICEIARDEGGIVTLAQNAGLPLPDFVSALGRDGCSAPPELRRSRRLAHHPTLRHSNAPVRLRSRLRAGRPWLRGDRRLLASARHLSPYALTSCPTGG